jgi:hypothetical protein
MQDNPAVYFRVWGADSIAYGPVELPTLEDWVRQERVLPGTWVFADNRGDWTRASEMTELRTLFKSKAPGGGTATANPHGITPGSLRRIRILADMDERQLASFLQYMEVQKFLPNALIFRKGDHGDAMFLVIQGEVRARSMVGGRESTLSTLGVGECFGELAVIDKGPRSADVVANSEAVLLKISGDALKRLFQEAPALAAPFLLGLSRTIASSVRRLTKRYEDSILFARTAGGK